MHGTNMNVVYTSYYLKVQYFIAHVSIKNYLNMHYHSPHINKETHINLSFVKRK
jgi:hypothetical protein